jgi:hypothetical protein
MKMFPVLDLGNLAFEMLGVGVVIALAGRCEWQVLT